VLFPRTLQEEDDDDDDANALQRRPGQIRWNRREFASVRSKIFGASRKHLFRFASSSSSSSFSSLKQQIELILLLFVNFWTSSQQSICLFFQFLFLYSSGFRYNNSRHRRLCNFTFVSWDFRYSDLRAKKQKSDKKKKERSSTLVLHAKPPSAVDTTNSFSEQEQNRTTTSCSRFFLQKNSSTP
jgi:hypothetical protein